MAARNPFSPPGLRPLGVAVFILLLLPLLVAAAEKKSYTLAVVPNLPAVTLHKNWTPFVEQLSRDLGVAIELKLYDRIGTFLEAGEGGQPDFIYAAPNMFYLIHQKQKYHPLVRSSQMLSGVVFVRKDAPYRQVQDLSGKTIAFVGPKNICSIITRHALMTGAGAIDYNASYGGSTVNVAKSVLLGKADAGATLDVSMLELEEMRNEFRTLLETDKVASHPLAAHPRVPKRLQDAVTETILAMGGSEAGRKLLATVKLSNPIRADFARDYGIYGAVNFERLDRQTVK